MYIVLLLISGFSPALGTVDLATWLREEFEADYKEDVDKIVGELKSVTLASIVT